MKKLIGSLLALALVMSSLTGVAAQEPDSAYAEGVGSIATRFDDRGNPVATLEVVDLITDWSDHEANHGPDRGYLYYAVVVNVTNLAADELEVEARHFSMVDSLGLSVGRTNLTAAEDAPMEVLTSSMEIAGGESADLMVVFELFGDVSPALLIWEAGQGQLVMVNLTDGSEDPSSVVSGLNTPAGTSDDRGNPIATIEVTDVLDDWQDHADNRAADRGTRYVAVSFRIINVSDTEFSVRVHDLTLVDSEGANINARNIEAADGSDAVIFTSNADVAPGETLEGTLIFQVYSGVEPVGLMWRSQSSMVNLVVVAEGAEDVTEVDEVAEPDTDDVMDATPAA